MNQPEPTYRVPAFTVTEITGLTHSMKMALRFWRKAKTPNARTYVREAVSILRKLQRLEVV